MTVYPVDGVKAACWVVIDIEQSALGTFATIASGAVKMVGFVLFTLEMTHYELLYDFGKKKKKKRQRAQELVRLSRGVIIARPHNSILRLGDLVA